jgi:hypothetical protein
MLIGCDGDGVKIAVDVGNGDGVTVGVAGIPSFKDKRVVPF